MLAQDAEQDAVLPDAEVITQPSLDLAAKPSRITNNFGFARDCCHPEALKLVEHVVADGFDKARRPSVPGNRHMNVGPFEAVEQHSRNHRAVALDAKGHIRRTKTETELLGDEAGNVLARDDHVTISATVCSVSTLSNSTSIGETEPLVT